MVRFSRDALWRNQNPLSSLFSTEVKGEGDVPSFDAVAYWLQPIRKDSPKHSLDLKTDTIRYEISVS